jgi:hypothetical protein|tara:strand:+ start:795 stop:902 length:108 start_codon:yes stop_codon:yes gene_type:complete
LVEPLWGIASVSILDIGFVLGEASEIAKGVLEWDM